MTEGELNILIKPLLEKISRIDGDLAKKIGTLLTGLETNPDGSLARTAGNSEIIRTAVREVINAPVRAVFRAWSRVSLPLISKLAWRDSTKEFNTGVVSFVFGARDKAVIAAEIAIIFNHVKQIGPDIVANLNKAWRESLKNGLSLREFKAKVITETGIRGINGLTIRERAELIGNTEASRMYESSRIIRDSDFLGPNHKRKWMAIVDTHTVQDSLTRNGQIMTVNEWLNHDFGDGKKGFPPLRPNDRCLTRACPE